MHLCHCRHVSIVAALVALAAFSVHARGEKDGQGPGKPPENATILFDGRDLSKWRHADGSAPKWKVVDGAVEVSGGGDIWTKDRFTGDFVLYVEFMPNDAGPGPTGQARGNSGLFIQDNYEIQVLDSHGVEKMTPGDCAGIYGKRPADKNVSKPPGQWQTYHITFRAPRFDAAGKKTANARITVDWNGTRVHDDVELDSPCPGGVGERPDAGPLRLQDHGNPVRFRNIWITPLEAKR
jgi:hypothetical protein